MLGAEAVTWGVLQGDVFLGCELSEDSCQSCGPPSVSAIETVSWQHWGTPVFRAVLVKEEVPKNKEVLTTAQAFVEAWALARVPG